MLVLLAFAFVSGVITILSPCILPVLPIVLSGSVGKGKARPFGVIAGFVASFTLFTLALTAIVQALGVPPDILRVVAVVLIISFGLVMLVPRLRYVFEALATRVTSRRSSGPRPGGSSGFLGGLPVGISLGLVWTPCVGPIMASVISLALTQRVDGGAVFITLAYTIGTSIPMLGVMLGGRTLLKRVPSLAKNSAGIQRGFGVLMILVGMAIGFGWDRQFQSAVLNVLPNYGAGLTAIEELEPVTDALAGRDQDRPEAGGAMMMSGPQYASFDDPPEKGRLSDYGPAPELIAGGEWFNTEGAPLRMRDLRGKVVLVDFWTYSCINCVRTIPYLKAWYEKYEDQGLVIVGVHTPEFEFEKKPSNVAEAMEDLGITWPVVQDNDYSQWRAYRNRYWPAHYFIDAEGNVRYFHYGEGKYDTSEKVIRALLKEAGGVSRSKVAGSAEPKLESRTPETYLGYGRARNFVSAVSPVPDRSAAYQPSRTPGNGEWNLDGRWTIAKEYIVPDKGGVLEIGFDAKNVFLVIEPIEEAARVEVRVDGSPATDTQDVRGGLLLPGESRLYQLVGLEKPGEHVLSLAVDGKLRLYAFTFG